MAKLVTRTITYYNHVFGTLVPDGNGGYKANVVASVESLRKAGPRSMKRFKTEHGVPDAANLIQVIERQELRGMPLEQFEAYSNPVSEDEAAEDEEA